MSEWPNETSARRDFLKIGGLGLAAGIAAAGTLNAQKAAARGCPC